MRSPGRTTREPRRFWRDSVRRRPPQADDPGLPFPGWPNGRAQGSCSTGGGVTQTCPRGPSRPSGRAVFRETRPRRLDDPEGRAGRPATSRSMRSRDASSRRRRGRRSTPSADHRVGSIIQKGGKVVHAWAVEGDLDPAEAHSDEIEIEWPPRSGKRKRFPEIDRVEWFGPIEARRRIKPTQAPLIDRLEEALGNRVAARPRPARRGGPSTRISVGSAPAATSEPRSGVTMSSRSRYWPGAVGATRSRTASTLTPGWSPTGSSVRTVWASGSVGSAAPADKRHPAPDDVSALRRGAAADEVGGGRDGFVAPGRHAEVDGADVELGLRAGGQGGRWRGEDRAIEVAGDPDDERRDERLASRRRRRRHPCRGA